MEGDDAPSESFKWSIEGFSKLTKKKYAEIFYLGGFGWRLLIFPKGNNVPYLSIYLHAADSETKSHVGWRIDTQITFVVVNQIHDKRKVKEDIRQQFNASYKHRGFASFMPLADLNDPTKGYLVNDTCIIEVIVEVRSVVPPKKITKPPSETQSLKRKKNSLDFFIEPPSKRVGSTAPRVLFVDPTDSAAVPKKITKPPPETQSLNRIKNSLDFFIEPPSKREGSRAPRVLHVDPTDSAEVTKSEEPPKKIDVSSNNEPPAKGDIVIEENTQSKPLPTLLSRFGPVNLQNPPYLLPNGHRITQGAVLDEEGKAAQLIQSAILSSELQPVVNMPVVNLASQGYYYQLAKIKHEEQTNVLEAINSRDLEIHKLKLSVGKYAQELGKMKEEIIKVANAFSATKEKIINLQAELHKVEDEFSAFKEKVINLEGELQLLHLDNIDLQIQLRDARQAEQHAVIRAVEDFKASSEYENGLRAMVFDSLELATEFACSHLKNKLPGFEPSMLGTLTKVAHSFLPNKADPAA